MKSNTYFYDCNGNITDKEEKAFAKKVIEENVESKKNIEKFYVQKYTSGINSGHFRNENGLYHNPSSAKNYKTPQNGVRIFEFKKVLKDAFEHYIKFLQTKNEMYLRHAERMF